MRRPNGISDATNTVVRDVWLREYIGDLGEVQAQHEFDGETLIQEAHDSYGSSARRSFISGTALILAGAASEYLTLAGHAKDLTALGLIGGAILIVGGIYLVKRAILPAKRYKQNVNIAINQFKKSDALQVKVDDLESEYQKHGYVR